MKGPSLLGALLIRLMLPLLLIVSATGALGAWWAQRLTEQTFDRWLLDSARALSQQVRFEGAVAQLDLGGQAESILSFDAQDRTYYSVRQGARLVAGHSELPPHDGPDNPLYFNAHLQSQPVRIVRLAVRDGARQAEVYIAETLVKRTEVRHDIQLMLAPAAALLLVTAGAIVAAVRFTLQPVRTLADRWLAQSHRSLEPVDTGGVPRELQPLANALNRLFQRLREVLARERRYSANAAHQIRTPLAGLQLGLARAAQAPDLETARDVIEELQQTTQRTSRLAQQLLALSRLDPEAVAHLNWQPVDLGRLAHDVGRAYLQAALDRRLQFDLHTPEQAVWVSAEPDLLSEALGNLIDNALRHGDSGGLVRIHVRPGDGTQEPSITVEDAGPGIPVEQRQTMLERFARGQNHRTSGSGLGLAIAQEIAELHGHPLQLADAPGCGLAVTIRLRPTPEPGAGRTP